MTKDHTMDTRDIGDIGIDGGAADWPARAEAIWPQRSVVAGPKDGKGPDEGEGGRDTGIATKVRPKTKKPSLYRVLLLNDDYTPMEFVVAVLQEVFGKNQDDAVRIMMHVHKHGVGECGIYPYEIAETKVTLVMDAARKNQHPLQCVMEKQ